MASLVCATTASALIGTIDGFQAQEAFTPYSEELAKALREGGIPAAANVAKHYVTGGDMDEEGVADDLGVLSELSVVVILARVTDKRRSLLAPGIDRQGGYKLASSTRD